MATKKPRAKRATEGRRDLSAVTATELEAELRRRKRRVQALVKRYEGLAARTAAMKAEIEALGGVASARTGSGGGGRPRQRAKNAASLVKTLKQVIGEKIVGVADAVRLVTESGYKSSSAKLRSIINQTLIKSEAFERVDRGQYKVK